VPAPGGAELTLGDAVLLVAYLGGYQGRRQDPPPGSRTMWIGWSRLQDMALGAAMMRNHLISKIHSGTGPPRASPLPVTVSE